MGVELLGESTRHVSGLAHTFWDLALRGEIAERVLVSGKSADRARGPALFRRNAARASVINLNSDFPHRVYEGHQSRRFGGNSGHLLGCPWAEQSRLALPEIEFRSVRSVQGFVRQMQADWGAGNDGSQSRRASLERSGGSSAVTGRRVVMKCVGVALEHG